MNDSMASRKAQAVAYLGECVVADGVARGIDIPSIRAKLRYVIEYSEVLNPSDIESIIEVGTGQRCA